MSISKLKSINKAALWEQWIGKTAYVSDKNPANSWQACEILAVVESGLMPPLLFCPRAFMSMYYDLQLSSPCCALGLKLRVIDNSTHPRPEMPQKRKRGKGKRAKRNTSEASLISIPWGRQVSHITRFFHYPTSVPPTYTPNTSFPVSIVATE